MYACMIYINENLYIPMIYTEVVSFSYVFSVTIGHYLRTNVFIVIFIVSMASSSREPKHVWTKEEEATLVECLVELVSAGRWRSNNGTFRPCYLAQLEQMMAAKLPGRLFQATIVIGCRIKTLKRTFQTIAIYGPSCSGFGWNER